MWLDFKKRFSIAGIFSKAFIKWSCLAILVGCLGGVIGSCFYYSIAYAGYLFKTYSRLLLCLPAGGVVIALIYKLTHTEGLSTENILLSIQNGDRLSIYLLPAIYISTFITHVFGGSAGREGAALQIGGSLGQNLGRLMRLNDAELRTAVSCGMAAVFSALFGTPVAATVFVLEVTTVGTMQYSRLFPCVISAFSASFVTQLLSVMPEKYVLLNYELSLTLFLKTALLAILCALLSVIICESMHVMSHFAFKNIKNSVIRALVGGLIIVMLTYAVGTRNYNGAGADIIMNAVENGKANPEDFILKLLFTAVTIGFGYKGGEIVPTFYIGATFGCFIGPLLGLPAQLAAAIAMVCTFCGAVNCPLASVILSMELFGSGNLPYFALACFISFMLSGYSSLYNQQKIVFSKTDGTVRSLL